MSSPQSLPRPSDRWIPWYIVAFFCSLVVILVPMCFIAVKTNTGVVTEHAYEKGLSYNKDIDAAARQEALGWKGAINISSAGGGKTNADFFLFDKNGNPLDQASVRLWLVRPTEKGMDRQFDMKLYGDGHYSVSFSLPVEGLWEARVSAMNNGENYQVTKRVVLP